MNTFIARFVLPAFAVGMCMPVFAADPPTGRLLASQCFQCHGTNGKSHSGIESIAGESANELYNELMEMKASSKTDVMTLQAKAYSDAELKAISDYIGSLSQGGGTNTTSTRRGD